VSAADDEYRCQTCRAVLEQRFGYVWFCPKCNPEEEAHDA
jgi:ribosomal protein L37AE/L43A